MNKFATLVLVGVFFMGNSAFAVKKPKSDTLFKRIGGKKAIHAVVDDFVGRCATDTRIKGFFAAVAADKKRLAAFKGKLRDQFCEASGGPCKYHGKDMKVAHKGMGVGPEHFDAMVEDLVATLNKFKIKPKDKKALLAILGPMKPQIVEAVPARGVASEN